MASTINLLVCGLVSACSLYTLRVLNMQNTGRDRFVFRAFVWWWLSWIAWTAAWAAIAIRNLPSEHPNLLLLLSDLNAVTLIMVYLTLTRAESYGGGTAVIDFINICVVVGAAYFVFYLLIPNRFNAVQHGWGLCLSAISTMLVGWAFVLRYGTRAVLVVGFVYAFSQPLAFESILNTNAGPEAFAEPFKLVLAGFKVVWAIVVTAYFAHHPPLLEPSIIQPPAGMKAPDAINPPQWLTWQFAVFIVAFVVAAIVFAGRTLPQPAKEQVLPILTAISALVAIVTGINRLFQWLRRTQTRTS
jgi:hypothetical protein